MKHLGLLLLILFLPNYLSAENKIKVLYITGQTDKNHSCKEATKYLVPLLEENELFDVDVYEMKSNIQKKGLILMYIML